jgi:uncharacterized membrane protein HdeD (DUF308 family)
MPILYASHWWVWAVRGVLAVLFGILTLAVPSVTLAVLIIFFGVWAILDGLTHLIVAARGSDHRGLHIVEGLIGLLAGVVALVWPLSTVIVLVYLIAAWAIFSGAARIALALQLRGSPSREWMIGLSGALGLLFGILLLFAPIAGALVIAIWIGIYAIVAGAVLLSLAFRMRARHGRLISLPGS